MHDEPPEAAPAPLGTVEVIEPLWEIFRKGGVPPCPRNGGPMALNVDGVGGGYRLVCVSCGLATTWFEAKFNEVSLRRTINLEIGPQGR